jgi:hypothetical protein
MKFLLKYKKIIIFLIITFLSFFLISSLRSEFNSGDCIKSEDGYIWYINNYSWGEYSLMGWQGNSWGNEVKIKKHIIERNEVEGIKKYHNVVCPVFGIVS